MSEPAVARPSIRRRMLLFLVSSLLLMVAGASAVSYWVALHSANDAYDRSLLDPALDIAENLRIDSTGAHVDLPVKALEALVYDQVDRVIFQVRSPTNAIVEGEADLPPPPSSDPDSRSSSTASTTVRTSGSPRIAPPTGTSCRSAKRSTSATD